MEWSMWANEQSVLSASLIFIGGIVGVAGKFSNWQFAAALIPLSAILTIIEYPRGKRLKGRTKERLYQSYLGKILDKLGWLIIIPSCFLLPTIMGGLCLLFGSILYLIGAFKGESWKCVSHESGERTLVLQPSRPAPRGPVMRNDFSEIYQNFPGDNTNIEQ
ncbi:DgyrCDS570 [Dimorphilus gyrociliatus]|uniref:Cytochrome b-245 light chain n=1 Tax=Dimorphilus gyrociliatus TaxID=2664684 RepID=A0A7I8V7J1_9ANNE|nr:DgyrCDS570 [Dimorphilus gyrociliatus]